MVQFGGQLGAPVHPASGPAAERPYVRWRHEQSVDGTRNIPMEALLQTAGHPRLNRASGFRRNYTRRSGSTTLDTASRCLGGDVPRRSGRTRYLEAALPLLPIGPPCRLIAAGPSLERVIDLPVLLPRISARQAAVRTNKD